MYLSVVIPAYNEAERLPETLVLVRDYLEQKDFKSEVLVVDDGSTDATAEEVTHMTERFSQLRLISNTQNKGKGGVVRQGMLEAKGEHRLFMDADNSTPITELDKFFQYFDSADVIIGSRYLHPDSIKVKQPWKRRVGSRGFNWLVRHTVVPNVVDTQCGFKVFSAKAAETIFPRQTMTGWSFDVELLTIAHQLGFKIQEVPVDWYDAKQSKFNAARAGFKSLRDLRIIQANSKQGVYRKST